MLLAGLTSVYADNGVLSVTNVKNVVPGFRGSFDIVLSGSTVQYAGYQFKLTLPEGLTYSGYADGALINGHASTISGNSEMTFTGDANPSANFTAMNGTLLRIYFTVSSTASGTLSGGKFTNIHFTNISGTDYALSNVDFSVTVGNTVTLDEDESFSPVAINNINVTVNRTLKAGVWNTIVLPFSLTAAQISANEQLSGAQIVAFTGVDFEGAHNSQTYNFDITSIKFSFSSVTDGITSHTPYLIKVPSEVTSFTVNGVNMTNSAPIAVDQTDKGNVVSHFVGTYTCPTIVPADKLYISDNKFKYSTGSTKLKSFRAYFDYSRVLIDKSLSAASRAITFDIDGESTTSIFNLEEGTIETEGKYYNLKGQRVANPTKGVYVVEGKKVMKK